jgi:hypothetical protein
MHNKQSYKGNYFMKRVTRATEQKIMEQINAVTIETLTRDIVINAAKNKQTAALVDKLFDELEKAESGPSQNCDSLLVALQNKFIGFPWKPRDRPDSMYSYLIEITKSQCKLITEVLVAFIEKCVVKNKFIEVAKILSVCGEHGHYYYSIEQSIIKCFPLIENKEQERASRKVITYALKKRSHYANKEIFMALQSCFRITADQPKNTEKFYKYIERLVVMLSNLYDMNMLEVERKRQWTEYPDSLRHLQLNVSRLLQFFAIHEDEDICVVTREVFIRLMGSVLIREIVQKCLDDKEGLKQKTLEAKVKTLFENYGVLFPEEEPDSESCWEVATELLSQASVLSYIEIVQHVIAYFSNNPEIIVSNIFDVRRDPRVIVQYLTQVGMYFNYDSHYTTVPACPSLVQLLEKNSNLENKDKQAIVITERLIRIHAYLRDRYHEIGEEPPETKSYSYRNFKKRLADFQILLFNMEQETDCNCAIKRHVDSTRSLFASHSFLTFEPRYNQARELLIKSEFGLDCIDNETWKKAFQWYKSYLSQQTDEISRVLQTGLCWNAEEKSEICKSLALGTLACDDKQILLPPINVMLPICQSEGIPDDRKERVVFARLISIHRYFMQQRETLIKPCSRLQTIKRTRDLENFHRRKVDFQTLLSIKTIDTSKAHLSSHTFCAGRSQRYHNLRKQLLEPVKCIVINDSGYTTIDSDMTTDDLNKGIELYQSWLSSCGSKREFVEIRTSTSIEEQLTCARDGRIVNLEASGSILASVSTRWGMFGSRSKAQSVGGTVVLASISESHEIQP